MASEYPTVRLRSGREFPLLNGHPWLFSGAFRALPEDVEPGGVVDALSANGEWLARGYLNARNSLAFRALTRQRDETIDDAFFAGRVRRALDLRRLLPADVTAYRLINAEADGLPGLIVDRFDRWLVAQFHTAGVERQRDAILNALEAVLQPEGAEGILVRDDIRIREREGLAVGEASVARGAAPELVEIQEGPARYCVDLRRGQKTGFFLDQRDKRALIGELARRKSSLLNLFSYTGGFALAALARNPALGTVNVDASAPALDLARRNYTLNGFDPDAHAFVASDVTRFLEAAAGEGRRFDIVVVDPPAFAKNLAARERALRGYEALNQHAAQVVAPDGLLLTCSCSGAVEYGEFESAAQRGLARAGRTAQLLYTFGPSLDHPSLPGFPEDRYLKALVLRVQ